MLTRVFLEPWTLSLGFFVLRLAMTDEKWHEYLIQKLTQIDEHLIDIKVEVAMLKGKSIVWGSISGFLVAGLLTYFLK